MRPCEPELCEKNRGLIHSLALKTARAFNCLGRGGYTEEALSAFVTPFIEVAMRRHLESSLGTLSLDPRSMALVRKVKRLRNTDGLSDAAIAEVLNISEAEVRKAIAYSTHFQSIYDLTPDDDSDVYDYITDSESSPSTEEIVSQSIRTECLKELFGGLTKREQDIIGKTFGVFGYEKQPLRDIAMYHMTREDAVEKAKARALKKMKDAYPESRMKLWHDVREKMKSVL